MRKKEGGEREKEGDALFQAGPLQGFNGDGGRRLCHVTRRWGDQLKNMLCAASQSS